MTLVLKFASMNMTFDIDGFGEDGYDFLEKNQILAPYKGEILNMDGVSPGMSVNHLCVYYTYLLDRHSPLLSIENIRERKSEAAKKAMLKKRNGRFPEWVQEIIVGSDYVNRVKNRMLYVQHNNSWALLVSLQNAYYGLLETIDKGDISKAKEAVRLKNDIDEIITEMNHGPVSMSDQEMVYAILEEESLGIRPEEYIPVYQNGRRVFPEYAQ